MNIHKKIKGAMNICKINIRSKHNTSENIQLSLDVNINTKVYSS